MAYVTLEYYRDIFQGEPVSDADFPGLLARAGEILEEMTVYRLTETSMESMSAENQERIRKAVCAQIEYLDANGGSELDMGESFSGATLGRYSYTTGTSSSGSGTSQSAYSPRAFRILWPTGLLYRGGDCL